MGWNHCSHGLTSRPLETCHHRCLSAVCGILGYPKGSAAELLDGVLKLRCCSTPFSNRFPTWFLPSVGDGRVRRLGDATGPLDSYGGSRVKRVRLTRKTRGSVQPVSIPDQGHSTSRRWKRLRPSFLRRNGGRGGRASQPFVACVRMDDQTPMCNTTHSVRAWTDTPALHEACTTTTTHDHA